MSIFDPENRPFDEDGLASHIERALAVEEPSGTWQEMGYRIVKRLFRPVLIDAGNIPDRPCLFVGNHSLFALDGMILMPMGAVIFVDFYLLRRFGLQSNYAELSRKSFNWAAGLTWFITMGTCVTLVKFTDVQALLADTLGIDLLPGFSGVGLYFVSLPGWFVAAGLYIVFSKIYQNKVHQ